MNGAADADGSRSLIRSASIEPLSFDYLKILPDRTWLEQPVGDEDGAAAAAIRQ